MNCLPCSRLWLLELSLLLLGALSSPPSARADREGCLEAHEQAQLERMNGRFMEARERLLTCAQASCPGVVRGDCKGWLEEVESSLPSVVFAVSDEQGRDLVEARVTSEAGLLSDRADGRALPLNPGVYKVRIEARGFVAVEQTVSVREGEKRRLVRVVLRPSAAGDGGLAAAQAGPSETKPAGQELRARRLLWSGYVLGGAGLAVLAAGSALGIIGHAELEHLHAEECKPDCDASEVAAGQRKYVAANVAFGVGGALLASAVVTWALGYRKQRERRTTRLPSIAADASGVSFGWGTQF